MSNDLERVEARQAEAKERIEGKGKQEAEADNKDAKHESVAEDDEGSTEPKPPTATGTVDDSQQEQAEQYFKQMIDQRLVEATTRVRQGSEAYGNGSSDASVSLSDSQPKDGKAPSFASVVIANDAPPGAGTTTTTNSDAPTAAPATVPLASSASATVPTLWTSEAAFFKSVDSFIGKFKSTDSFAAFAETQDFHSNNIEATEALREFLVSRSLQKDNVLSQEWVPQYEQAHQDVDTTAVFSQQSVPPQASLHAAASSMSQQDRNNQVPSLSQDSTFSAASLAWLKEMHEKSNSGSGDAGPATKSGTKSGPDTSAILDGLSQDSTLSLASMAWMREMYEKSNTTAVAMPPLAVASRSSENTSAEMVAAAALIESATSLPLPPGGKGGKRKRQQGGDDKKAGRANNGGKEAPDRVYLIPTDQDVLCGRGGRTNHHPGNKVYLAEKEKIQQRYMAASKQDKTAISQELVDRIHELGGRFLEQDSSESGQNRWYVISALKARKKASQTLRELNTPEERKAKRERYAK